MPDEVYAHLRQPGQRGAELQKQWEADFENYAKDFKDDAAMFRLSFEGKLPEGWDKDLPVYTPADGELATRRGVG
ncbi:MAG: hypothetical protein WKG07_49965 [Hymenobacter sp.]